MPAKKVNFQEIAGLKARLKDVRLKHKFTYATMARHFGVTNNAVKGWEIGKTDPPLGYLEFLAETYGYDLNWLILGTERPPEREVESGAELELLRDNRALRREVDELKKGGPGLSVARPAPGAELAEE